MKKMTKMLALMLAVIMILTMAACSSEKESSEPAEEAPAQQSAPAEEAAPIEEAPVEEAAPEETAYAKVVYELPLFEETKTLTAFYALRGSINGSMPNRDDLEFWKITQDKLNVDVVFQEPGEAVVSEKYNLMVASGDMTDLIFENMIVSMGSSSAYNGGFDKAIADDVYVDLMDYVEEYAPNYAYYILGDPANRKNAVTDEGHLATFLQIYSEKQLNNMGNVVNTDHFEATGLELPTTVSEWMDVYAAMADNGVKYPVEVSSTGAILQGSFANAMGASIATGFMISAETEEFVFGPTTDETREYIELFRELNQKGWMHPDWMNINAMDRTLFNNGEVSTRSMMINEITVYEDMYGIPVQALPVVCREGYDGNKTAMGSLGDALATSTGGVAISTACEDIETAMKFMDFFYSDEGADAANMGWEEGLVFEIVDGEKRITTRYQEKNENDVEFKNLYTHDGDFALCYPNMRYDIATEDEKKMYDMWAADTTNEAAIYYSLPQAIALTSEESESITSALTDLETYVETTVFSWMALESDLTDATWEEFVATCESMRLAEIQETYEAAYQRYVEK